MFYLHRTEGRRSICQELTSEAGQFQMEGVSCKTFSCNHLVIGSWQPITCWLTWKVNLTALALHLELSCLRYQLYTDVPPTIHPELFCLWCQLKESDSGWAEEPALKWRDRGRSGWDTDFVQIQTVVRHLVMSALYDAPSGFPSSL